MTEQVLDHSFIVRVWFENDEMDGAQSVWRGRIIHVPSGENLCFEKLDRISHFIRPYLQVSGADYSREDIRNRAELEL